MKGRTAQSVFGAIEQRVAAPADAAMKELPRGPEDGHGLAAGSALAVFLGVQAFLSQQREARASRLSATA